MPTYLYRSKEAKRCRDNELVGGGNCPCWRHGVSAYQHFDDKPLEECPECGAPVYRAIVGLRFRFSHSLKNDGFDYREDLAAKPNDPEAYVDGPRALRKLIDKRKRQGWQIGKLEDAAPSEPKFRSSEDVVREAYERAAAKGFTPSDD